MLFVQTGCRTSYYAVMEKFGQHKRDLLRQSLTDATEQQREVEQQFKDALTRLQELTGATGGELQERYEAFKGEYETSKEKADTVQSHIREVEQVADDLFAEWEQEIGEIQSPALSRKSRAKLSETKARFEKMRASLIRAETGMEPVLAQMKDYVLYLKHNLNAQAIGSLKNESLQIEEDISTLIDQMNRSIQETEDFIEILEIETDSQN
ncbi:MAG: DUF2959 domain-containing protein [Verrucomicrobia bacterium]|nr:DUF2959 domain-containing protein [Verrucomicrobiota bacterium]